MSGSVFVCLVFTICFIGCIKDVTSLECYSCQSKNTANSCQATSSCGQNQVCMLRRTVNNQTQEIHYESKCEDKTDCDLELDRYKAILSALVGKKRAMMKQIVAGDVCLIQCCDQDLCNNGCVMSSNLSYTMTSNPFATTKMIPANQAPTNSLQNMTALTQSSSDQTSLKIIIPTKPSKAISTDTTPPRAPTTPSVTVSTTASSSSSNVNSVSSSNTVTTPYVQSSRQPSASAVSTTSWPLTTTGQSTTTKGIQNTTMSNTPHPRTTSSAAVSQSVSTKDTQSTRITESVTPLTYTTKIDKITTSSPIKDCPYGFVKFDNSCYLFGRHEMSFHDAHLFCAKHNSHLVHVDSSRENNYLKNHFKNMHRGPIQYWIGITDEITENVWQYYDSGKVATFYDWSPGEPDGTQAFDGNAVADCAVFDPYLDFQWRDEDCSPYQVSEPVCEISQ